MDDNFDFARASAADSTLTGLDGTAEILIGGKDLRRVTDTVLWKFIPQFGLRRVQPHASAYPVPEVSEQDVAWEAEDGA